MLEAQAALRKQCSTSVPMRELDSMPEDDPQNADKSKAKKLLEGEDDPQNADKSKAKKLLEGIVFYVLTL